MAEVEFREFDPEGRRRWLRRERDGYVAARIDSGDSPADAEAAADGSLAQSFPGGEVAGGQLAGWVVAGGETVGTLWVGPFANDPTKWWVWTVEIDAGRRGQGLGRAAMLLAEELARGRGATSIGLNVFGGNTVARTLYESLGYDETSRQMRKAL